MHTPSQATRSSRVSPSVAAASGTALALLLAVACSADAPAGAESDAGIGEANATGTAPDASTNAKAVAKAPGFPVGFAPSLDAGESDSGETADAGSAIVDAGSDAFVDAGSDAIVDAGSDAFVPVSCFGSEINCGGACINPSSDRVYCGATLGCGAGDAGAPGTSCDGGMICNAGTCQADCGSNLMTCGGACVDTQDDPTHCGGCDTECAIPHGTNVCSSGTCALLACNTGFNQCPPVWQGLPITACAELSSDPLNCGYCGHVCALSNATSTCAANACALTACTTGYLDCDSDPTNGCETLAAICPPSKKVFITSTTSTSIMGGYAGADALCAAAATAANLTGTFFAWISDGAVTPASRFSHSTVAYALVDGSVIANNWTALVGGSLRHPINLTESGGTPPPPSLGGVCNTWTGTAMNGTAGGGDDCSGWTSTSDSGSAGNSSIENGWSSQCYGAICSATAALFCFEQ